jgi:uncharacterized damage-inducible protein DinB
MRPDPISRDASAERRVWFDRQFDLGLPVEAFPDILERVRGTPLRLRERVMSCPEERLRARGDDRWSVLENAGHLLDLEPLWAGRLDELLAGEQLRPADLQNRRTHEAGHNDRRVEDLLGAFAAARLHFVARLEALGAEELRRTALHPRLRQPMSVVDLVFFVAEHDDHHLARITEMIRA